MTISNSNAEACHEFPPSFAEADGRRRCRDRRRHCRQHVRQSRQRGSPRSCSAHARERGRHTDHAGQDAFGTIQEIVRILEADPTTDWSKVNIAALREHLIDMNEVTLHAAATERVARQRRRDRRDWRGPDARRDQAHGAGSGARARRASAGTPRTEDLPNGVRLVVTSDGSQAGHQAQGARLHGHHGAGRHIISFTTS